MRAKVEKTVAPLLAGDYGGILSTERFRESRREASLESAEFLLFTS